jgi:hypothetical protein
MSATVTEIWRYPVKSMGGETIDAAAVGKRGCTQIVGGRCGTQHSVRVTVTLSSVQPNGSMKKRSKYLTLRTKTRR